MTDDIHPVPLAARADPIPILLEEYRQLYSLALYRLQVLDQRIPLATAAITAVAGSVSALPASMQPAFLVTLPIAAHLVYLSTINHARSLEDALARLSIVESRINESAGAALLSFQSTHPSRHTVGGRTGHSTVAWVHAATLALFAICACTMPWIGSASDASTLAYWSSLAGLAMISIAERLRFGRYRYIAS